jgi:signal transduction histidine kinase
LVKNAIQSIPKQERKTVFVTVKDSNNVLIIVEDNGIGIKRRYQPFSNLNLLLKNSGMGLGLGIIKNIIENYKGTITFETEYGKGTRSSSIINS